MAKLINNIIQEKPSLQSIIEDANRLQSIHNIIQSSLGDVIANNCNVSAVLANCLQISVSNQSWATKMRYLSADLLRELQKYPKFNFIAKIAILVDLNHNSHQPRLKLRPKQTISIENARHLYALARHIQHLGLRNSLLKIADRSI